MGVSLVIVLVVVAIVVAVVIAVVVVVVSSRRSRAGAGDQTDGDASSAVPPPVDGRPTESPASTQPPASSRPLTDPPPISSLETALTRVADPDGHPLADPVDAAPAGTGQGDGPPAADGGGVDGDATDGSSSAR